MSEFKSLIGIVRI